MVKYCYVSMRLCALRGLNRKDFQMEYVLIAVLLISALFIVAAVIFQDSNEEGLSGTISGKSDTYYGRDKSTHKNRVLFKWTLIFAVIFALAVFLVYAIQPDIAHHVNAPDSWTSHITNKSYSTTYKNF